MNDMPSYTPPKVWTWDKENGGRFASTNRPIAGATHEKELPVGELVGRIREAGRRPVERDALYREIARAAPDGCAAGGAA